MQIKANKCRYAYCEIMACPSGCLNGGGQIKFENELEKESNLNALYVRQDEKVFREHSELIDKVTDLLLSDKLVGILDKTFIDYQIEELKQTDSLKLNW